MNKRKKNRIETWIHRSIFCSLAALLIVAGVWLFQSEAKKDTEKIEASTVVTTGEFRLTANNKWDNTAKRNYAQLDWDSIPNLTQSGYKLYQSENGINWEIRSLSYGKSIKVLNVYPDIEASNTLKTWMDSLELKANDNTNLIQVTPVTITDFNANPNNYLKNGSGEYQYDVVMFGSWDWFYSCDLSSIGAKAVQEYIDSDRGVLFGHDTLTGVITGGKGKPQFGKFANQLGITLPSSVAPNIIVRIRSEKIKVNNDGYLMKYPFEIPNGAELSIPETHTFNQSIPANSKLTKWLSFIAPFSSNINTSGGDGNYYLITNNNLAMIQTGHSMSQSSIDERKIIANTLYNLAQVSLENNATDYSVLDDKVPEKPETIIRCGSDETLSIKMDAKDKGKEYQFYVEADTRDAGLKKSDVVKENIISNIAGYFYEVTDSPTTNLATRVESLKDEYGRIDPSEYDIYVAPDDDSVDYDTSALTTISEKNTSEKYVHVLAVDRANNISTVSSNQIKDLIQPVDFEVERTADEAKLVDVAIDPSIGDKMKSIEIQIPKNTEIKNFTSLTLPSDWYSFENSETDDYYSFSFAMEDNNAAATIKDFLESLLFTIKNPVNDSGSIKVILHEKVYTSWIDENGVAHYYVFMPEFTAPGKNWFQAYNSAKKLTYRGLTGYLATIMSEEEHDFIFENIAKEPGWLGGTRGRLRNGTKINDEETVPQRSEDYDTNYDEWYWANGPETGKIFFVGKVRNESYTPSGAYSAFSSTEPNNSGGNEYALQFAQAKKKFWNDLQGEWTYNEINMKGYYVEFSEYGGQTEGEEITDLCWSAAIPQKISLKAYDDKGGALPLGDILYDQELRLGKAITVQPKELEFYTFLEAQDSDGAQRGLSYTVTNTYQEGKLIYSLRKADINIRQVIVNSNTDLVVPKEGYLKVQHQAHNSGSPAINGNYQLNTKISSDKQNNNPEFTKVIFATNHLADAQDQVQLSVIVPEFYKVSGYSLSNDQASHTNTPDYTDDKISLSRQEIYDQGEFWITLYLEPNGTNNGKPQPYSWD
ncbi:hypothetical protein, partial [Enterococcus pallens]